MLYQSTSCTIRLVKMSDILWQKQKKYFMFSFIYFLLQISEHFPSDASEFVKCEQTYGTHWTIFFFTTKKFQLLASLMVQTVLQNENLLYFVNFRNLNLFLHFWTIFFLIVTKSRQFAKSYDANHVPIRHFLNVFFLNLIWNDSLYLWHSVLKLTMIRSFCKWL